MDDEMSLIGLKAFAEMLDIQFPTEPDETAMMTINNLIKNKLDSGVSVSKTVQGFTPLMLYSTYQVLDDRFDAELGNAAASTDLRSTDPSTSRRINALSCAVSARNLIAIERLLATNMFSDSDDYEVALELVALLNFSEAIPVFVSNKCNLFACDGFSGITPLMYACALGHVDVAREILLTNPSEEKLNTASKMGGETASALALKTENEALIALFSNSIAMKQQEIIKAITEESIEKIQEILNVLPPNNNLLIVKSDGIYSSLSLQAYILPPSHFREQAINILDNHLATLSFQDQINTLVLTCSMLIEQNEEAANKYLQILVNILDKHPEQKHIKEFLMPMATLEWNMTEELWEVIKNSIMPKLAQKIEFSGYWPYSYDEYSADHQICTINCSIYIAVPFINSLFANTNVIQCKLLLPTIGRPLSEIVALLCERNQKMSQVRTTLAKEKTFNYYVDAINILVERFKGDNRVPEDLRNKLEYYAKRGTVYSLAELTAFTIYKHPQLAKEKENLPIICQRLVDDMSKLSMK